MRSRSPGRRRFPTSLGALALAALLAAALCSGSPASAASAHASAVQKRLSAAEARRAMAIGTVNALRAKLPALQRRLAQLQKDAGRATLAALQAMRNEQAAAQALAAARGALDARARAAFEAGPATTIDAMLGARSLSDVSAVNEYASRTLQADNRTLQAVQAAQAEVARARAAAEAEQRAAVQREEQLSSTVSEMQTQLDSAIAQARDAGLQVRDLTKQLRQIRAVRASQQAQQSAIVGAQSGAGLSADSTWADGTNQNQLLALLGPDGGRSCAIPQGLQDTGKQISGDASWYGWDFAGQSTASGATFDPRLMTAANRTLPFGTFLRVRWQSRCVIVLVNDRGPYGDLNRVIDLSLGAAQALGSESAGVVPVTADILVPR